MNLVTPSLVGLGPTAPDGEDLSTRIERDLEELVGRIGSDADGGGPGDVVISSRYRFGERLGEGGVGEVWRARHLDLGIDVAIKVLKREHLRNEALRTRVLREAAAICSIRHPNVVTVHDVGRHPSGGLFIVMDLIEGETLQELLEREGRLPFEQACPLFVQIASALTETHASGIVHRDLKPGNVLVQRTEQGRTAHLIDFGLAGIVELDPATSRLTRSGEVFGTPLYMSPEAIRGERATAVSDVYAFGCLAYEVLAGQHPFERDSLHSVLSAHLFDPPPRAPLERTHGRRIAEIIERALEKDPSRRWSSAREMAAAFEALARGAVPRSEAPPRGWPRRARRLAWLSAPAVIVGAGLGWAYGIAPATRSTEASTSARAASLAPRPSVEPPVEPPPPSPADALVAEPPPPSPADASVAEPEAPTSEEPPPPSRPRADARRSSPRERSARRRRRAAPDRLRGIAIPSTSPAPPPAVPPPSKASPEDVAVSDGDDVRDDAAARLIRARELLENIP